MTKVIKDKGKTKQREMEFDTDRIQEFIYGVFEEYDVDVPLESKDEFVKNIFHTIQSFDEIEAKEITDIMVNKAKVLTQEIKNIDGRVTPNSLSMVNWDRFCKGVTLREMYKRASKNRAYESTQKYGDYLGFVLMMVEKGIYSPDILKNYSHEELKIAGGFINPDYDKKYYFAGILAMRDRYIAKDFDNTSILELPQERNLMNALDLMMSEPKEIRLKRVQESYEVIGTLKMTNATPTFRATGLLTGNFASCFIDTVDDSLRGIYDSNTDVATLSKFGSGIGVYVGKVRGMGSSIRGYKGASSGVIPWLKQLNNTAISVDQLGQRQGAIAVYIDIWHSDAPRVMDIRLNTGDESLRAYDLFSGICYPDFFMQQVENRGDFYLFDPHEIRKVMGFNLEDFYDKKQLRKNETPNPVDHAWTYHYMLCVDNQNLGKTRYKAVDLMKKIMRSGLETGIPFMFNRDLANRDNPNKHEGMIYSSNLCTEISQNMSATTVTEEYIDKYSSQIIIKKDIGDMVVCNLNSTVLDRHWKPGITEKELFDSIGETIKIQVRMADNVIEKKRITVQQALHTNERYRGIGIGEQGRAGLLAMMGIKWDSDEAVEFIARLEENIMYHVLKSSSELAEEKGSYPLFEGSEWNTGEWLEKRKEFMTLPGWDKIIESTKKGMRNGYVRAIAPTGTTSVIAGSTASTDPIFDIVYSERKKKGLLPMQVPNLNAKTFMYYKPTMRMVYVDEQGNVNKELNHMWSIKMNSVTQRWVDQAISHNVFVPDTINAKNLLTLYLENWKYGNKTSYYIRSWDKKHESTCQSCES